LIAPSPVGVSESRSAPVLDDGGIVGSNEEVEVEVVKSDDEEDEIDNFMEAGGCEPNAKEDIRGWRELRDQIKADLETAHKRHETLTHINQLLVLRNFATLRIRGVGRIAVSMQIVTQWQDGVGSHFARQIRFLARHYQLFEQLPPQK
jgi:hypothetical protein